MLHITGTRVRLPDTALISLLDAAIARCPAYDTIRMLVARSGHNTFNDHFQDYVEAVRAEMHMAEIANDSQRRSLAYAAAPQRTARNGMRPNNGKALCLPCLTDHEPFLHHPKYLPVYQVLNSPPDRHLD